MFPVILYTLYTIANFGFALYLFKQNNWRPFFLHSDNPVATTFLTFGLNLLIIWWLVATVGWIAPTVMLLFVALLNTVVGLYESDKYGDLRFTLKQTLIALPFYAFIVIGLWAAV